MSAPDFDFSSLTQRQVADMLAVSPRTVRRWTSRDGLPRRADGTYAAANVIAWLLRGGADWKWLRERRYLTRDLEDSD